MNRNSRSSACPWSVRILLPAVIGLGAALAAPTGSALAQETMTFQEVSPDSARTVEVRRVRSAPAAPATPAVPAPPDRPAVSRAGDLVRIGSDIHVERDQVVEGDVFAMAGDIRVEGRVKGNVAATGGNVHLAATARVDGDVMCIGGDLTEEEGAVVVGQRVTAMRGGERLRDRVRDRIDERIEGEIEENTRPWRRRGDGGAVAFAVSWILSTVLVAWAIARFLPGRTQVALDTLKREPAGSLLMGFVLILLLVPSVVALALAMAVLCITIIGIPLAILLLPTYGLALALIFMWGFTTGCLVLGERIRQRTGGLRALDALAAGGAALLGGTLLLSSILHNLPLFGWVSTLLWVIGFVAFGVLTMAGAGALLRSKFGQGPGGRWWPPFGSSGSQWTPGTPAATPAPVAPAAPAAPAATPTTAPSAPPSPPPAPPPPPPSPPTDPGQTG